MAHGKSDGNTKRVLREEDLMSVASSAGGTAVLGALHQIMDRLEKLEKAEAPRPSQSSGSGDTGEKKVDQKK